MTKDYRSNSVPARSTSRGQSPAENYTPAPKPDQATTRLATITVICVLLALTVGFLLFSILRDISKSGNVAPITSTVIVALSVASLVGLWNMKKWGVYAYAVAFILFLVLYLIGIFNAGAKTLPIGLIVLVFFIPYAVMLYLAIKNLKNMR